MNETRETFRAYDRRRREQEKWQNEMICFESTEGSMVRRYRLPRRRCTASEVQKTLNNYPESYAVGYVMEAMSKDVVHLEEMMGKCRPKPAKYVLIPTKLGHTWDAAMRPHYEGTLMVVVEKVPRWNDRGDQRVTEDDLTEWLLFGLLEEDVRIQRAVGIVGAIEDEIATLVDDMAQVPFMQIHDSTGKPKNDADADKDRDAKYAILVQQKECAERKLNKAKAKALDFVSSREDQCCDIKFTILSFFGLHFLF